MTAYIALFSALLSRLTAPACDSTWVTSFLNIHRSGVLTALAWLVSHETAAVSAQVLCTPYKHAPCHFMQSHIRKVYACLAVTCHLHFWQNDQDLLRATIKALHQQLSLFGHDMVIVGLVSCNHLLLVTVYNSNTGTDDQKETTPNYSDKGAWKNKNGLQNSTRLTLLFQLVTSEQYSNYVR